MVIPLFVGREKSIEALEYAMASDKEVLLVAQRNAGEDDPGVDDIYQVGTVSTILQLLKLPDGTVIGEDPEADAERFHVSPKGVVLVTPEMLGQEIHHVR